MAATSVFLNAQTDPPPPTTDESTVGTKGPCGSGDGGTTGPSPPVGLCLPINNYLLPGLVLGIAIGSYKLTRTNNC